MDDDEDIGLCGCGSPWFELRSLEEFSDLDPAVCINEEGTITGYAGQLHCVACGSEWSPHVEAIDSPSPHLHLVHSA